VTDRPVEQQEIASTFYAALGMDVSYFPAIWHTYKVGQLLMADLDRICRGLGLSMADVHLLGVIRIDAAAPLRATDLAQTLHVSNAVLSTRIARLEVEGQIVRTPSPDDRRAFTLQLTPSGADTLDRAIQAVNRQSNFLKRYRRLSETDRAHLARIMGALHDGLDRDFISTTRGDI
jgi:DNA-binding MarR family transcriptional regulator